MRKPDKPEIKISLTGRIDSTKWEFGRQVLEALRDADARLLPDRIGNSEPIKIPVGSIEECEKYWAPEVMARGPDGAAFFCKSPFMWKRARAIKSWGHVMHTLVNNFGEFVPGWLIFTASPDKKPDWHGLFSLLCGFVQPSFATMHLCTEVETRPGAFGTESSANYGTNDFLRGSSGTVLKMRGVANLAWATFFGREYAAEVDPEKLRAHGFAVEAIAGGFLVTITPSLFDVAKDFPQFSARRAELKKLFRPGLFRIQNEPAI